MAALATIFDGKALLDTALAALAGGIGVTLFFSIAIYGYARFEETRRVGRGTAAFGAAALASVGILLSLAAIGFGLVVMVGK